MRERIERKRERGRREREEKRNQRGGGRPVGAHSGHRTSGELEPVGTRDACAADGGVLAPLGLRRQVDNEAA